MDKRQLEYFIAVAELLNFTKAAKKFYISQTAVSQQIKLLENILKTKLFERNNRKVILTAAGKYFYREAKLIVENMDNAFKNTAKVALGYKGNLRVGFLRGHTTDIIYNLLNKFHSGFPDIDIYIVDDTIESLYEHLKNNSLDIIFSANYSLDNDTDFKTLSLGMESICAVMSVNHHLSNRTKVKRSELKKEKFVFINRNVAKHGFDTMISSCIDAGFSPQIVHQCNSLESVLLMVKLGIGITLLPKFNFTDLTDNLCFIPLEGYDEYVKEVLIWNEKNSNPNIDLFLNCIKS